MTEDIDYDTTTKRPHCSHCNGVNVLFDAYAEWDHQNNIFTVQNIMDKGHYCADCEGECSIEWKEEEKQP